MVICQFSKRFFCQEGVRKKLFLSQDILRILIYDVCMVDQLKTAPAGAETWRAPTQIRNPHALGDSVIGPSGTVRFKLDRRSFYVPPEQRAVNDSAASEPDRTETPEIDIFTPERPGLANGVIK